MEYQAAAQTAAAAAATPPAAAAAAKRLHRLQPQLQEPEPTQQKECTGCWVNLTTIVYASY